MKVSQLVAAGFAFAIAQTASAGTQIGAAQLAGVTAAVETCEKLDRRVGARVEQGAEILLRGVSEKTLASLRNSAEYRSAYSQYVQLFASIDAGDLARLCAGAAAYPK